MRGRTRGRRRSVAAIAALVAGLLALIAVPVDAADPWTLELTWVASADGTPLRTTVFKPLEVGAGERAPVVLLVTPYDGSGGDAFGPNPLNQATPRPGVFARHMLERGYAWVEVRIRGVGGSGGCYDYGGPGEQADAKAAVEWAASQPWSTGKVGMVGHSYDGQTQLMAMATRANGLAAVIPGAPPSGYTNNFTNGVSLITGRGFPAFYAVNDLVPPSLFADPQELANALQGDVADPLCLAQPSLGSLSNDPAAPFWRDRDLAAKVAGSTVPMLWVHGFDDWNVRPASGLAAYRNAAGFKRAVLGPWDHSIPTADNDIWTEMRTLWFDAFVKDDPASRAVVEAWPAVQVQGSDGRWRGEAQWPPGDATRVHVRVAPGTYLDAPGNNSEPALPPYVEDFLGVELPVPLPTGIGTWSFGRRLTGELHLAGLPELSVSVSTVVPGATIVGTVYDVAPDGRATMVARGASLIRDAGSSSVTFALGPQDWRFAAGHRVGLLLSGGDTIWLEPGKSLTPVQVLGGALTLPAVQHRDTFLPDGPFVPDGRPGPINVTVPE